ncbi:TetR/AcrR family transcriptional regulator [Nocardiopsis gilva YIM 90087]|uniref:TetR/AcrR family transcriptional regulator n=2 Tax=Nocardiopsis gilva TaxID=280236 RepID=A0A223SDN0_9ACTN|nr:TetR/AcrR family transcriptional regulator [Nocardiopsis gilva]ASU86230.1 TetR/AcrR family transcriptional regulator [Nocardiopsis gilva YIM 90087]
MVSKHKRLPRQVREQQMIDAAVQVFSRVGYHTASVDEIAEAAGVSKPMVYIYVGSKEGLFTSCIHREADRLVEAVRSAARHDVAPEQRLWEGLRAFFRFVADNRESWKVLYQQARSQGEPFSKEVTQARCRVMDEITALVIAGTELPGGERIISEKDAEIIARIAAGAADALTDWLLEHPQETPEELTMRVMEIARIGAHRYYDRGARDGHAVAAPPGTIRPITRPIPDPRHASD